jgi:hypothetical protein
MRMNGVVCVAMLRSCKEDNWGNQVSVKESSWKGAAVQRGLEPGSRGIAIVTSHYQQLLVKALRGGRDLA